MVRLSIFLCLGAFAQSSTSDSPSTETTQSSTSDSPSTETTEAATTESATTEEPVTADPNATTEEPVTADPNATTEDPVTADPNATTSDPNATAPVPADSNATTEEPESETTEKPTTNGTGAASGDTGKGASAGGEEPTTEKQDVVEKNETETVTKEAVNQTTDSSTTTKVEVKAVTITSGFTATLPLSEDAANKLVKTEAFTAAMKAEYIDMLGMKDLLEPEMVTYTATVSASRRGRALADSVSVIHTYVTEIPAATVEKIAADTEKQDGFVALAKGDETATELLKGNFGSALASAITTAKTDDSLKDLVTELEAAATAAETAEVVVVITPVDDAGALEALEKRVEQVKTDEAASAPATSFSAKSFLSAASVVFAVALCA